MDKVPAICFSQNETCILMFTMNAGQLYDICYFNPRELARFMHKDSKTFYITRIFVIPYNIYHRRLEYNTLGLETCAVYVTIAS